MSDNAELVLLEPWQTIINKSTLRQLWSVFQSATRSVGAHPSISNVEGEVKEALGE